MTALLDRPATVARTAGGSGWRPALRMARRELLRAPGRTLLVLLMVLLPVTAVVALDTLLRTGDISVRESLDGTLGDAEARVDVLEDGSVVRQSPDARQTESTAGSGTALDEQALRTVLPRGSDLLAVRDSFYERGLRTPSGRVVRAVLVGADLRDPATRGPYRVLTGSAPGSATEVAVTRELADAFPVGSTLVLRDGQQRTVTGTVAWPMELGEAPGVLGLPAAVGVADVDPSRFYVSGAEVGWDDVLELNGLGAVVLSRSVLRDPPPGDRVPDLESWDQAAATTAAVLGLITVMAVLEVVLLAGPAFAVGARRSRRALALLAATGGEPRHVRRVVLAQGLLVGGVAALVGAPLGIAVAALARAPLSRWGDARWGPFEVSVRDVLLLSLLGAGTALLAALVPAVVAARSPVVASLQGRRAVPVHAAVPTVAGIALLAVGVVMCVASLGRSFPELAIAFSALPTVLGAVLLSPLLLAGLGRLAARLPLPLRYAVRDADRQRSRTAPAVAAVAATVAAAVALGTAASSDEAERRATWVPSGPVGAAVVTGPAPDVDWAALESAARSALPGEPVRVVRGLVLDQHSPLDDDYEEVLLCAPEAPVTPFCDPFPVSGHGSFGGRVLVGEASFEALAPLLDPAARAAAGRALEAGSVVRFGGPSGTTQVRRVRVLAPEPGGETTAELVASETVPAVSLPAREGGAPALAFVDERLARELGGASPVGLVVGTDLSRAQETRLQDALSLLDGGAFVSVERGRDDDGSLVLLLLGLGAGALVLAGTLAATSLALVESAPDFRTLAQVGARPRDRRAVAGAYAGVLALTGAALGSAAGLLPGVAAGVALTRGTGFGPTGPPGTEAPASWGHLDVPWLLVVGLIVVLPLLAAVFAAVVPRAAKGSR